MMPDTYAPHELIESSYSDVQKCVSSLVELAKVNPNLIQEVIELSIVVGINAANRRIEKDKLINKAREIYPGWSYEVGENK